MVNQLILNYIIHSLPYSSTHKLKHRKVTLLKLESCNLALKILTVIKNSA